MRMRAGGQQGQASVEWVGLVALVLTLALAATVLFEGEAIAGAVVRQIHRALCIVSGGDCERDRVPCVRSSDRTDDEAHLNLGLVRIGRHEVVLVENRSDGTVAVTYIGDVDGGIELGLGADLKVSSSVLNLSMGESARAAALVRLGKGKTWIFQDARSADAGMAELSEHRTPHRGRIGERITHQGVLLGIDARGETGGVTGSLHLGAELVKGNVRGADGSTTHVLSKHGEASLMVGAPIGSGSGTAAGDEIVTVTTDKRGRLVDLGVSRTGELTGSASLPDVAQGVAGAVVGAVVGDSPGVSGSRRWAVEQHLDLTDPFNREAAAGFLAAIADGNPLARPGAALRARLETAGLTDVRTYDLGEESGGVSGHVAAGEKLGGGVSSRTLRAQLVDARQRGPDGLWRTRTDCLPTGSGLGG